ncbi:MFS family permease [Rhizobium sp. SG_E_25_P2]|uniref:DUF2232 domain-containing protein n=1 Tax=Rhizobium sp. SG_E_25_P2 TaxID=2879942 RepID=UPI002476CAEE|nr:DUF2232 domain-containing protein [Rhizobium sp. SG_E_25_P2]MDH6266818.1 MFS family permease [Rhizobium sp. SG_E_25_P2]
MTNPKNPILIGVIAGLAAAALMAAGGYFAALSIILIFLSLAAIFVAGLGFGLLSCIVAIGTAALANAFLLSSPLAFLMTAAPLVPAVVMSQLANTARPASEIGGPDTATAWYPLSDVLFAGAVLTAIASVYTTLASPQIEALYSALADAMQQMMTDMSGAGADMDTLPRDEMIAMIRVIWPLAQALQMMIALFAGFYFAMRFLSASGRNIRPREDMAMSLRMNRVAIVVFLAGVVAMFAGGMIGMIGSSLAGACAGGFLLAGFAVIHSFLRGKSWGLPGLVLVYLLTFFFLPVIGFLLVIAGGLANPRRAIPLTQTKPENDAKP